MIKVKDLEVMYKNARAPALKGINLEFGEGEFTIILGPSGAGKSTLLRCLNGLIKPAAGRIFLDGQDITKTTGQNLRKIRRGIGFIFQQFNLVKRLSVKDNVFCGRLGYTSTVRSLADKFSEEDRKLVLDAITKVGLQNKLEQRADTLSGGEQQRVAIARALVQKPRLMLADEPIASLDHSLAHWIMDLLKMINEEWKITLIVSLHNLEMAKEYGKRIVALNDGRVVFDGAPKTLNPELVKKIFRGVEHEVLQEIL